MHVGIPAYFVISCHVRFICDPVIIEALGKPWAGRDTHTDAERQGFRLGDYTIFRHGSKRCVTMMHRLN